MSHPSKYPSPPTNNLKYNTFDRMPQIQPTNSNINDTNTSMHAFKPHATTLLDQVDAIAASSSSTSTNSTNSTNTIIPISSGSTTPVPSTTTAPSPSGIELLLNSSYGQLSVEQLFNKKKECMNQINLFNSDRDMSRLEFDTMVQSVNLIRNINGGDDTFHYCICNQFQKQTSVTVNTTYGHTYDYNVSHHCTDQNTKTYKNDRLFEPGTFLEPSKPSTTGNKWTPQIKFNLPTIQSQLTTGSCNYLSKQLKQLIIFLQMYGGSKLKIHRKNVWKKYVTIDTLIQAKKGLIAFGVPASYYINEWAPKLVSGFHERLGGVSKLVEATRVFFSDGMIATAQNFFQRLNSNQGSCSISSSLGSPVNVTEASSAKTCEDHFLSNGKKNYYVKNKDCRHCQNGTCTMKQHKGKTQNGFLAEKISSSSSSSSSTSSSTKTMQDVNSNHSKQAIESSFTPTSLTSSGMEMLHDASNRHPNSNQPSHSRSNVILKQQGYTSRWTQQEKRAFEEGLTIHGRGRWALFLPTIPTKTQLQIRQVSLSFSVYHQVPHFCSFLFIFFSYLKIINIPTNPQTERFAIPFTFTYTLHFVIFLFFNFSIFFIFTACLCLL